MKTRDIKQWLQAADVAEATSPYDSDDDMAPGRDVGGTESPPPDWETFVATAAAALRSPKPRRRDALLTQCLPELVRDKETSSKERAELYMLLLSAGKYHAHRKTWLRLLHAGDLVLDADTGDRAPLDSEVVRTGIRGVCGAAEQMVGAPGQLRAPVASVVFLLWWMGPLMRRVLLAHAPEPSGEVKALAQACASVCDALYAYRGKRSRRAAKSTPGRPSVFRHMHLLQPALPLLMRALLATPAGPHALRAATTMGVVMDVCASPAGPHAQPDGPCALVWSEFKIPLLQYLATHVLASKAPVPRHVLDALRSVMARVTQEEAEAYLLPTLDKMLLRSPEVACAAAQVLFEHAGLDRAAVLARLQQPLLSAIGSANAATRAGALALVATLTAPRVPDAFLDAFTKTLKGAEARGEEQRRALYTLLHAFQPDAAYSARLVDAAAPLVQKEAQPHLVREALAALWRHAAPLLGNDTPLPAAALGVLTSKAQLPKPAVRAAALCSVPALPLAGQGGARFAKELLPLAEKAVASGSAALTVPESALEACAGVEIFALLATPAGTAADAPARAALRPLLETGAKLPFLINDKVVRKLRDVDGSAPAVYAHLAPLGTPSAQPCGAVALHADALARVLAWRGYACLHDAALQDAVVRVLVEGLPDAFGVVHALLAHIAAEEMALATRLTQRIVYALVCQTPEATSADAKRLRALLEAPLAPARHSGEAQEGARARAPEMLAELVVLTHVAQLHDEERTFFVDLCRYAHAEPYAVVHAQRARLLEVLAAAQGDAQLGAAADAALATVAFIAPAPILPLVVERVVRDLSLHPLDALPELDVAIWSAPPSDKPFVDVLARDPAEPARGQQGKMERWDAEVRASLARKQGAPQLSKQQQAAVDAQRQHEAEVRAEVEHVRLRMEHGVRAAHSLAVSGAELAAYLARLLEALHAVLFSARGRTLGLGAPVATALTALARVGEAPVEQAALAVVATWLARADPALAPLDLVEPAMEVELRVLYQLRLLVERAPLSLVRASFFVPWFAALVEAAQLRDDAAHDDAAMERMQLVVECLRAHSAYGSQPAFPREAVLRALLLVVRRFSMLAHEAVGVLRAYGEAIARTTLGAGALAQQLLDACLAEERRERDGALQCLVPMDLTELEFSAPLFLALHAGDEETERLAARIWSENAMDVPEGYVAPLVALLEHPHAYVRSTAPRALGSACAAHPASFASLREALTMLYDAKNFSLAPEYDRFGMVIESTLNRQDPWAVRAGVAHAFAAVAPQFAPGDVLPFFAFLLRTPGALGDRSEPVRRAMLEAASAVVDAHGASVLAPLIAELETSLGSGDDAVTEAAVVLLGRAAQHLASRDAHVRRIVDRLLDALHTPSELVQEAVGACLPPLVRTEAVTRDVPAIVDALLATLLQGEKYAARRGAAYGLAGVVEGAGIGSIKALRILPRLADAVSDTSHASPRQGAMFAYEVLAKTLRVLFEPYVPAILPQVLQCFGDNHADVREATQDAARVLMQSLSGQCVKQILPGLLAGLEEKQWRTKRGAIELLGAMAYCAPRQLSASLPVVIPRLSEVLTDSHTQVRNAANRALKQFGEVIHNPEVHALVPNLLKALVDPNAKTGAALKALLGTKFVHYIDAPSLALIAPILERGLKERAIAQQKQAAQIVGNLASLTDTRDFVPYLGRYTPLVREVLVSPVPDARSVAAKALGTLVERLGEVHFLDLVPSLLSVLQTNATGVDRHGAAQGLAEVLAGLGMERMESLLPSIIANTGAQAAYVREGHLALLIYLPATFGNRFVPHLPVIVPPIMASIADEDESVREASMRAGRMLIANYLQRAVDLLLPQLEPRLFAPFWRVRLASLQLTSDLLFRLSGISGKAEVEEEHEEEQQESATAHSVQRTLQAALGDRRPRLLAAIYVLRQDPNIPVRQAAAHTWKALVQNTPRTAREVLPVMIDLIIAALAAPGSEQHEMAGRTLGELVRKLGEKILHETIPLLAARAAEAPQAATRAGVCAAIADILANATKTQLEDHEEALIAIVRGALVDAAPQVRAAAARTFDAVQAHLGSRAIDTTIPTLLGALRQEDARADTALAALREIVRTRPEVVFPVLVPALAQVPLEARAAHALATLVPVAGVALSSNVSAVLSSVARTRLDGMGDEAALEATADAVFASLADIDALHQTMLLLLSWMSSREGSARRALACRMLVRFCAKKQATLVWDDYTVDCLRKLIGLLEEDAQEVGDAALDALHAVTESVPKTHWEALVLPARRTLASTGTAAPLPGLVRPRAPQPLVTLLLHGLMHGSAEQRENGALGLGEVVEKSTPDAIKPLVTSIVGPLIRLCGDRHAPPVKTAILTALDLMVRRIPQLVRPFYPQLQRSFQKALGDTGSNTVRTRAGAALGVLMQHQMRVDQVCTELLQGIRASMQEEAGAEADVGDAQVLALAQVLHHIPRDKLGESVRASIDDLFQAAFLAEDEVREPLKKALAELSAAWLAYDATRSAPLWEQHILQPAPVDVQLAAQCVRAGLEQVPDVLYAHAHPPAIVAQLAATWMGDAPSVARPAREARDLLRRVEPWRSDEAVANAL